jgi:hypothetical protein
VAPEVRELSRRLLPESDQLGARMAERICAEIPLYAKGEVVSVPQLASSCADNVRYVMGQLAGQEESADRAWLTGTERAERGVPYAAVLEAYRIGARFLWELLVERADPEAREVLLLAAADIWTVSDELAGQVTDAYRAALAELARRDNQRRAVVVGALLDGETVGVPDLWESVGSLNLDPGGDFVVVAAECPAAGTESLPGVERALRRHNLTSAWRLEHGHQDGLVVLRFGFGVDELVESLASLASGRVGVSAPFHLLEEAPAGRRQARLAILAATPGSREVLRFDEHPLAVLLASTPERADALVRAVLGPVLDLPSDDRAVTLQTVQAWLDAEGSTSTAAERLYVHRNTVRYRLRRFEELTGCDLAKPVDAAKVHVALECVRILGHVPP